MSVFLALDQGTTSTRALRVNGDGAASIVFSAAHQQYFSGTDRVEHDPEELLANLRAALAAAGNVTAIGLSNQGESCLAWDAIDGRPLSPVIVWQDRRTTAEIAALSHAQVQIMALSGLPLSPYFSAAKLAWLLENNDDVKAARKAGRLMLGTTDAFFLQRLTGRAATDITTASRTALMNIVTGQWDATLCDLFGVPMECLPPILPTVGDFGSIDGTALTASVVDQQAALYGHGCRVAGDTKITFGTGAFALSLTGSHLRMDSQNGLLPTVAWSIGGETSYATDGGVHAAGAAIDWAQRIGLLDDPMELNAFEAGPAIDRGLAFVPALAGLGSPHWDDSAAGLFIGMTVATTRQDMQQALIEGIALRASEIVAAMGLEAPVTRISVDGGVSRSRYLCQFLADTTGCTVVIPSIDELTAYGTAQLAACALGETPPTPQPAEAISPNPCDGKLRLGRFLQAVDRARGWHLGPVD
ncbi:FGGY family carbohydrate kinase [Rhizobium sp. 18055]|uniref:FGGY family carbohydrate kinase n=1 Tax=Rhizobium sp. 18055 TaxID=2681403 RepID=UPI00135C8BB2|nr:FGGY family carbohydrate kinase [Rhizobium sp. 18055]